MSDNQLRREVNSLLNYTEDIIFEDNNEENDDVKYNKRANKRKDDSKNAESNNKHKNKDKKKWSNPVLNIINNESVYDKSQIYKALVKQDGLYKIILDLKEWSKNPKHKKPNLRA